MNPHQVFRLLQVAETLEEIATEEQETINNIPPNLRHGQQYLNRVFALEVLNVVVNALTALAAKQFVGILRASLPTIEALRAIIVQFEKQVPTVGSESNHGQTVDVDELQAEQPPGEPPHS